jgi:AcrR family transcriptional regulator
VPRVVDLDHRRAEMAEAAARVIARSGIQSATMREVASEAGCTTGALTHYFADRRELLLTTFEASLASRRSRRPPSETTSPLVRLRATLEGALPLDDERRRHWLVTLTCCTQAAGDDRLATAQRLAYREFRNHVATLLRSAGLASRRDARPLAERLIAGVDGLAVQALFDPESFPRRVLLTALDALLELNLGPVEWRLPVVDD